MSKFNLIALAVAATLAAPAAYAVDVTTTADVFPTNAIVTGATVSNTSTIEIAAGATDNYLGRSTGYNVKVTLTGGAKFNTAVDVANVAGLNGEAVTIAGGGGVGSNSVTFSVVPVTGVVEGDGIEIDAGAFDLTNVDALKTGGTIGIDVRIGDPVGGNELASKNGTSIASAQEGWVVTYTAPSNVDARIDVGVDSSKKRFSSTGDVNLADTALFNAGSVTVSLNPDLTDTMGLSLATATAPLTITGVDFSAFKAIAPATQGKIFLTSDATCAAGTQIAATVAANGQSASIPAATTATALNTSKFICFQSNDETVIAAQTIGASLSVKQATFTASPAFTDAAGKLLAMKYNGSVVEVDHFNPASNATQISYLRVINPGTVAGLVSVSGVCDDGSAQAPVSLNLAAGNAVLLTAADLKNGAKGLSAGFAQCSTGKSRLTVTGEFAGMKVQNFLRNVTADGGQINTNVNNQD